MITNSIKIVTNGSPWLLLLFAVVTIIFTVFVYRRTNPVISTPQKFVLIMLRLISLVLLLLVIYETLYKQNIISYQKPVLAVVVDNSASMSLTDEKGNRAAAVNSILSSSWLKDISNSHEIRYYCFAGQTQPNIPDSLDFIGDATNISEPLQFLKNDLAHENLTDILLLSDGNYNAGGNPARTAENIGLPVHSIGIGSANPNPDLSISNVDYNKTIYINNPTPIKISIRNQGFGNVKVPFNVMLDGERIKTDLVSIASSPSESEYTFEYTPSSIGRKKLELSFSAQTNEQSIENNKKTIYVDVIKSKIKISLIAGNVSPDISFLKNTLLKNSRYELTSAILNQSGAYFSPKPEKNFIEEADIFILLNFPTATTPNIIISSIVSKVQKSHSPILLIEGRDIDTAKLSAFENYLPVRADFQRRQEITILAEMSQAGALNPIMKFGRQSNDPDTYSLADLPPVYTSVSHIQPWPNSEVLAFSTQNKPVGTASTKNKLPLLLTRINQNQKSATIFAYGLWRWAFLLVDRDLDVSPFSAISNNLVRWLEPDNSDNRLHVELDKYNFSLSDKITANIELMDFEHNPIDDADLVVTLKSGNSEQLKSVDNAGDGKYKSTFNVSTPGDYILNTTAFENGEKTEFTETNFTVGEYTTELTDTRMQRSVLENLSLTTGGKFIQSDSAHTIKNYLIGKERKLNTIFVMKFWNNLYLLLAIILLLSTEWLLRKRKGML